VYKRQGYFSIYDAPSAQTPFAVSNVKSIEIDYDNRPFFDIERNEQVKKEGNLVPNVKTLIGTLVFSLRDASVANDFSFEWDRSTIVLDIFGRDLTGDGNFDGIDDGGNEVLSVIASPNGGEVWYAGNSYNVHWTLPSFEQNVWVELSIDNGDSWFRINELPVDVTSESYKYFVENSIESPECLVRIVDAATDTEIDRSDASFAITQPKNRITKPASADEIYVGGQLGSIEWETDVTSNVRFEFLVNGREERTVVPSVAGDQGSVEWTIPTDVNTDRARITMWDATNDNFLAASEEFRVLAGDLDFTAPTQNSILSFDEPFASVEWINNGVTVFDLEFSRDGGKSWEEVENTINAFREQYDWLVPNVKTEEALLRALHNGNENLEYDRTGVFAINSVTSVESGLEVSVNDAAPNPFRESTSIRFTVPNPMNVTAELYNAAGLNVATLSQNEMMSGERVLTIDATELQTSGVYFVKLTIGDEVFVKELVLTK